MELNFFEDNVKVRYSEMDYDLVMKPSALLQFMQDFASENAEALGFGYSFIIKHNLAWFLLKYRIEFSDYPQNIYDLKIKTKPRGFNKLFAFRDFEICAGDKVVGRAASTWALVDLSTKSMANTSEIFSSNKYMLQYEKQEGDLVYDRIRAPEKVDCEKVFSVRFDDLDVNKHVNNANYIVWAFEAIDFEFRKANKLKTLDMVFKKEISYGNNVIAQCEIKGDTTVHVLKNAQTGDELCLVKAVWTNK